MVILNFDGTKLTELKTPLTQHLIWLFFGYYFIAQLGYATFLIYYVTVTHLRADTSLMAFCSCRCKSALDDSSSSTYRNTWLNNAKQKKTAAQFIDENIFQKFFYIYFFTFQVHFLKLKKLREMLRFFFYNCGSLCVCVCPCVCGACGVCVYIYSTCSLSWSISLWALLNWIWRELLARDSSSADLLASSNWFVRVILIRLVDEKLQKWQKPKSESFLI